MATHIDWQGGLEGRVRFILGGEKAQVGVAHLSPVIKYLLVCIFFSLFMSLVLLLGVDGGPKGDREKKEAT